jgi:N6-L-threonylcarbamoyladenine synthase
VSLLLRSAAQPPSESCNMHVLGIESSCDETAVAIVNEHGEVLADVVQSQVALHARYGGVVPELASRDHLANIPHVLSAALEQAGVTPDQLTAIAVTHRPGLTGALLVGVQVAKGLALASGVPLVGVDHLVGHLFSPFLRRAGKPHCEVEYPFVALLASGGHTALYRVDGPEIDKIRELASSRDDAAGEAFDKGAKLLGLGYPGGPLIDALAKVGDPLAVAFSVAMPRSLEFSFSGLKTQLATLLEREGCPTGARLADVGASYQRALVSALSQKLLRAAEQENVKRVVIGGGVAANAELRATVTKMAQERGILAIVPEFANCTDNAAMIAYAGMLKFCLGGTDNLDLRVESRSVLPRATRKGGGARTAATRS